MSKHYAVDKPDLHALIDALSSCGAVVSAFLKSPVGSADDASPLANLFADPIFMEAAAPLGRSSAKWEKYATLNRLEFEGSLIAVLLEGGCHRQVIDENWARLIVKRGLAAVFPAPFDDLTVWRIDDFRWCELSEQSTISHAYIVRQGARALWWLLCITDFD